MNKGAQSQQGQRDLTAQVRDALEPLAEAWNYADNPNKQLEVISHALRTAISSVEALTGRTDLSAPLHELVFALEKLETKQAEAIQDFLERDYRGRALTPAIELRASMLTSYQILQSALGRPSKAEVRKKVVDLFSDYGSRSEASVRAWLTGIHRDPANELYRVQMEAAKRSELFGLTWENALHRVRRLSVDAISRLGAPRTE